MKKSSYHLLQHVRAALGVFLSICMIVGLFPVEAFASSAYNSGEDAERNLALGAGMTVAAEPGPTGSGRTLHVDGKTGDDSTGDGTWDKPYKTINKAAQLAHAGDTVLVSAGLYREQVKPLNSGTETEPIVYKADGEVIIKASEPIPTIHDGKEIAWMPDTTPGVWKTVVPDSFFEEPVKGGRGSGGWTNGTNWNAPDYYNPFRQWQWNAGGQQGGKTAGAVYSKDYPFVQKESIKDVRAENGALTWFYQYSEDTGETTIYANFGGIDPNAPANDVEINTRRQNFAPDEWGLKYITVDGFTMMNAGNWYSSFPDQPERAQRGAISVYGGKGWVIQNNSVINARTIGVDIGLGCDMWASNESRGSADKPEGGYRYRFAIDQEEYGHHTVQNNYFYRCGQGAVAGVFSWKSNILYNRIEDTNWRQELDAAESGAIKVHYFNYGLIEGNYIRNFPNCNGGAIWTDWGGQGIRITKNIVVNGHNPFYAEAVYGPILVDNNIFIGTDNLRTLDSTGIVFANNLSYNPQNNGTAINIDGQGRNCYWFQPGTMAPKLDQEKVEAGADPKDQYLHVTAPKMDFWWYNNIVNRAIPDTNTSGYIKTHNKKNNTDTTAMTNFAWEAGDEVKVSFNLDTAGLKDELATKEAIGKIMFPEKDRTTFEVGEEMPADVTSDFFGRPYAADAAVAGPFSDVKNGRNEYTVWPVAGQGTPKAWNIEAPVAVPPGDVSVAMYKTSADSSHIVDPDNENVDLTRLYDSDRAFDNSLETRWTSTAEDGDDAWVQVDLGGNYALSKIQLNWDTSYARQFKLQVSDTGEDGSWTDIYTQPAWTPEFEDSHAVQTITNFEPNKPADGGEPARTEGRYIRLQGVERAVADSGISLWMFEVFGKYVPQAPPPYVPVGEVNLANNQENIYANAYSSYSRDAYTSDKAIDGNASTRWGSDRGNANSQDWIYVDLGKAFDITKVVLQWEAAYGKEYEIQISDDAGGGNPTATGGTGAAVWTENVNYANSMNWETVFSTKQGSGGKETIDINRKARSVRMKGIKPSGQYGFSIYSFEVYGTEPKPEAPVNVALGKPVTAYAASSESNVDVNDPNNDRTAYRAFDGETSTRWGANERDDNWIQVDLGKQYIIDKVVLDWEASYAKQYKIQVADSSAGPWRDVYTESNGSRPATFEDNHFVEEIPFTSPVTAQAVRMQGVEKATQYGYSLWEFGVYGKEAPVDTGPQWPNGAKLAFSDLSSTGLTITWPNATDTKGVDGYKIYKDNVMIADVDANVTTYNVTGLEDGKKYSFKIEPYNTAGKSGTILSASTSSISADPRIAVSDTYPKQYSRWMDALPAGNGKMGILVFGNPRNETVVFNDKDFFTARTQARPNRSFNQVSAADLKDIRDKLIAGDYNGANAKANQVHGWNDGGEGNKHPGYKMTIDMPGNGTVQNYSRSVDYAKGLVSVKWSDDTGDWERTSFVSRADGVTVQYLPAPQGKKFSASFALGIDEGMHLNNYTFSYNTKADYLNIRAKYPAGSYDAGYEGITRIITDGTKTVSGNSVAVSNASYVLLLSRTQRYDGTFVQDGVTPEKAETAWAREDIQKALGQITGDYTTLLNRHTAIHSDIFNRVSLNFNASAEDRAKSNEELLAAQKNSSVMLPALYERLFYSGRYLMLAASGDKYAPDLLGNWTGDSNVGWGGFYHLDANLNLQISGGNIGNMPEAMNGYFWLLQQWKDDFKTNASKLLGTRGMLTAGNTPNDDGLISSLNFDYPYQYVTGGVSWLLYPLWEHYLITGDKDFLNNTYYPLVREMGDFYEDFLVEKDSKGKYIFAGSISPETRPTGSGSVPLAINSVYDISGARFALQTLIESSDVLNKSGEPVAKWQAILDSLPGYIINKDGALAEYAWPGLADKVDYQHRHSSALMPVWPYREITAENNKALYDASREFTERKAQGSYENAGHGLLHASLIAANNNSTDVVRQNLLRMAKNDYYYNSLATAHYNTVNPGVYCTDIAISLPTVLMEMLATTDRGRIELLPALPAELPSGSIDGMLGRSRFKIDHLNWDMDKHEINVTLTSDIGQTLSLIQRSGIESIEVTSGNASIAPSQYGNIARNITLKAGETSTLHIKIKDASKVNLALNKTAAASSKSNDQQGAEKAFDGISDNSGNRWGGDSKNPEWLQVDLGDVYDLNEVVIDWEASYAKDYKIQVSMNGTDWTDAYTQTGLSQSGPISHPVNALGRYVRMYSDKGTGPAGWGLSIYEMEVYGQLPANIAQNKQASAGSTTPAQGYGVSKAFDGDNGSRWSGDSKNPEWVSVDLGDVYDLYKVAINWEASYAQNYILEVSNDGKEWTKATERTGFTGGKDVFLLSNVKGRYVRMYSDKGTGPAGWGLSIYEFEVYGVPSSTDTQLPVWPEGSNVTAYAIGANGLTLAWTPAQDNIGVTGYIIYNGTNPVATVTGRVFSYNVTGLRAGTEYTFTVKAVDAAGNVSEKGLIKVVMTGSPGSGNNSGNNNNTGSTTPVQTGGIEVKGGVITITPKVSGSQAVSELSESDISKAMESAAVDVNGEKMISIEVKKAEGVNAYIQELPAVFLSEAGEKQKFRIATDMGTVVIPGDMLTESEAAGADKAGVIIKAADGIGGRPAVKISLELNDRQKEWSNADAPITVLIPYTPSPAELADPEHIVAGYTDINGKFAVITTGKYDAATGTVSFTTTQTGTFGISYANKTFTDIGNYKWAQKQIEVLASKGIINGVSGNSYMPGEAIKRADFIVLLVRTLGLSAKTEENFDDVKAGSYYADALSVAKKLEIAAGVGGNRFNPDAQISRQDMMILIDRAMSVAGKQLVKGSEENLAGYADRSSISAYAEDSVATLIRNGIITGSGGSINPKGMATRAETAVMLYGIYNR